MLDFIKIKNDLESSFNRKNSEGVDVDINISVINEDSGKFSVSVFDERCYVNNQHLPHADITVGFLNKDTMIMYGLDVKAWRDVRIDTIQKWYQGYPQDKE